METAVSKGRFAELIGVSAGRVSQYLAEGKISPSALVGTGRNAKILIDRAKADLRLTLDVGQRLGNGIDTRLDDEAESVSLFRAQDRQMSGGQQSPIERGGIDYEIKQQKLEDLRRKNRSAAIAEAQNSGQLTETAEARAEMMKLASNMLLVFEGGLTDFASAMASEYKLPHRDVLHLLRREFRKIREKSAKIAKAEATETTETLEIELQADDISEVN